jgi:hypothetical protein
MNSMVKKMQLHRKTPNIAWSACADIMAFVLMMTFLIALMIFLSAMQMPLPVELAHEAR